MSVTPLHTHQSAMVPYFSIAAAGSESYSETAVLSSALLVKMWPAQGGGEGGGGDGDGGGGEGAGGGGEGGGGMGPGGGGDGGGGGG